MLEVLPLVSRLLEVPTLPPEGRACEAAVLLFLSGGCTIAAFLAGVGARGASAARRPSEGYGDQDGPLVDADEDAGGTEDLFAMFDEGA